MRFDLRTQKRKAGSFDFQVRALRLGEPYTFTCEGEPHLEKGITNALIFLWTRKADRFVATAMELLTDLRHRPQTPFLEQCAGLVNNLDGTGGLEFSLETCATAIRRTMPAFVQLTGKKGWSGYGARRAEYESLVAISELIDTRVASDFAPSCRKCFIPLDANGHQCQPVKPCA